MHAVEAPVTFEHDAVAGEVGQYVEIGSDAGLTLRNLPGTDVFALAAAHADLGMKQYGAVALRKGGSEGAQVDARCIVAVHAAPGDVELKILAAVSSGSRLDRQPVEWRQPVANRPSFRRRPVGYLHPVAGNLSGMDPSSTGNL